MPNRHYSKLFILKQKYTSAVKLSSVSLSCEILSSSKLFLETWIVLAKKEFNCLSVFPMELSILSSF